MIPGEIVTAPGDVEFNAGRPTVVLAVANTGDRPVQVGSHYHFFEANRALSFDRSAAFGMRLNIPAGTAVRFEPGEEKDIELTEFGGARVIHGGNGLVGGAIADSSLQKRSIERARKDGFQSSGSSEAQTDSQTGSKGNSK